MNESINGKVRELVDAMQSVLGNSPASLHEPYFAGNEWSYVKEAIDSTLVSSVGPFVSRFEEDLAKITGSPYVIATGSGTGALHIALLLAGVLPNDEVIVPTLSFVATANSVAHCYAIPHFVDVSEETLGLDATALRRHIEKNCKSISGQLINRQTGRIIRAVVPMHAFGHPVDMRPLIELADEFGMVVVEDAAESLGSWYNNSHTGTIGLFGILSFNGNKTITTGGGGAILASNKELAARAKHLTTTGKLPHAWRYQHDEVAWNYRLPNLNAALGCAQIENLPFMLQAKRRLTDRYLEAFSGIADVQLVTEPKDCKSNYWLQTLILKSGGRTMRDSLLSETHKAGYQTRPVWDLLHTLKHFLKNPRSETPVANYLADRIINLPSSSQLGQ